MNPGLAVLGHTRGDNQFFRSLRRRFLSSLIAVTVFARQTLERPLFCLLSGSTVLLVRTMRVSSFLAEVTHVIRSAELSGAIRSHSAPAFAGFFRAALSASRQLRAAADFGVVTNDQPFPSMGAQSLAPPCDGIFEPA